MLTYALTGDLLLLIYALIVTRLYLLENAELVRLTQRYSLLAGAIKRYVRHD